MVTKKPSKPINPFAISKSQKLAPTSSVKGADLLSAIASSVKTGEAEKMPKISNEKKRKNQTSLLQFSKKREAKDKDSSDHQVGLSAMEPKSLDKPEKENVSESPKPKSAFFASATTKSPMKETPNEAREDSQMSETQ